MESVHVDSDNTSQIKKKSSKAGLFLLGLVGGTAVGLSIICYPFISPAWRKICLPYVPATPQQISNVLKALRGRSGTLLDIGSGDGRIVLAAARIGFQSSGVELNYILVLYSRYVSLINGLTRAASFYHRDLWKFYLKPYRNIVIFGVEEMMSDLAAKFDSELDDARVIACRFPLPAKNPMLTVGEGIDKVWVYHFNSPSSHTKNN